MNLLLFNPADLGSSNLLSVTGERSEHIRKVLKLGPGDELRVGEINGGTGSAEVVEITSSGAVVVRVGRLEQEASCVRDLRLIVALPRPQILKKVLQTAAMFGAAEICFCGAKRVEKSYWSSKLLRPEATRENLLLGMEQGEVTRLPEVQLVRNFSSAVADEKLNGKKALRLYADRGGLALSKQQGLEGLAEPVVMAIGPEGGWVDSEREIFENNGFLKIGLGRYNLRVEVAAAAALGQLELFYAKTS